MKKVIIIGAGVSGLTCGIYAQKNGFATQIFEAHNIPGGECTGWDRGGYHFDGCIHWLVGSKPGSGLNKVWHETGALDSSVRLVHHDIFAQYEENGRVIKFYSDTRKLEQHLCEFAPEDAKEIHKICNGIRKMGKVDMPLSKPMDLFTKGDWFKFALSNIGSAPQMMKYNSMSVGDLIQGITNPVLRRAFCACFPPEYTAISLLSTLGGLNIGDNCFPGGGSRALSKRMEAKYLGMGGSIRYKSRVEKILVEGGKAVGILLADGSEERADYVVSCADGYNTLTNLLDDRYTPQVYRKLFDNPKQYPTPTSMLVFLGVNAYLPCEARAIEVHRDEPVTLGGRGFDRASILNYNFDPSLVPQGKTVMAVYYSGDFDYWNKIYQDKEAYKAEKQRVLDDAIAIVTKRFPEVEGKIEVTNVVTPMTYVRYCSAWRGSWMTWVNGGKDVPQFFPGLLDGLDNFILSGIWTMAPGGLPGAAASGLYAAQRLCIWNGIDYNKAK